MLVYSKINTSFISSPSLPIYYPACNLQPSALTLDRENWAGTSSMSSGLPSSPTALMCALSQVLGKRTSCVNQLRGSAAETRQHNFAPSAKPAAKWHVFAAHDTKCTEVH